MTFDNKTIGKIVQGWGINNPDVFASATLMRPYQGGARQFEADMASLSKKEKAERAFVMQENMKKQVREMLGDETKWPKDLIFIGRNMRIVQGNNQYLGSPVNRIKLTGSWASRSLVDSPDLSTSERVKNFGRHLIFKCVLFTSDIVFYISKVRQTFGFGGGMEDDIEAQMKSMAKDMGIELQHSVFEG